VLNAPASASKAIGAMRTKDMDRATSSAKPRSQPKVGPFGTSLDPAPEVSFPLLAIGLRPESEAFLRRALPSSRTSTPLILVPEPTHADSVPTPLAAAVVDSDPTGEPHAAHVAYIGERDPGAPIIALVPGSTLPSLDKTDPALPVVPIPVSETGIELLRRAIALAEGRASLLARLRSVERAFERRSERFQALTMATRVAVWDWDLAVGRIWRSEGFEILFGYPAEDVGDTLAWWSDRVHPEDREWALQRIEPPRNGDDDQVHMSYRFQMRDGTYARVLDSGVVLRDENHRPVRMLGTIREATEANHVADRAEEGTAAPSAAELAVMERLSAIERVTDAALAHLSLEGLLQELLARLRGVLGADAALAHLITGNGNGLNRRAWIGIGGEAPRAVQIPFGSGLTDRITETGKPMVIADLHTSDVRPSGLLAQFRSFLGAPLIVEGKTIGVLSVLTREPRVFTQNEQALVQIVADRVASAVDRASLAEHVRADHRRLEALSHRLVGLQEEERRQIARDLHDGAGQLLMALQLSLDEERPDRERSASILRELSDQLHGISMSLRPPMLDDLGLLPALRWHLERFKSQTGVVVRLDHQGLDRRFRPELEIAAFRIVQEALTNVARHAHVKAASVGVTLRRGVLHVEVTDRGTGFDPDAVGPGVSAGLIGMRERASLLGGMLSVQSSPGGGTKISSELPGA